MRIKKNGLTNKLKVKYMSKSKVTKTKKPMIKKVKTKKGEGFVKIKAIKTVAPKTDVWGKRLKNGSYRRYQWRIDKIPTEQFPDMVLITYAGIQKKFISIEKAVIYMDMVQAEKLISGAARGIRKTQMVIESIPDYSLNIEDIDANMRDQKARRPEDVDA
jgi:hypothetical protein